MYYFNNLAMIQLALVVLSITLSCDGANRGVPKKRSFYIYKYDLDSIKNRSTNHQIHPMILARRSLREMNGKPISKEVLMSLFEASRWAPSYFNTQSWRYVYATRNGKYWEPFLDALNPGNRKWAKDAAVLIVALSNKFQVYKDKKLPVGSHSFDTGASWMSMALEGTARGLVVHAMTGFDKDKASQMINLPDNDYDIEAIIAVGNRAKSKTDEKTTQRNEIETFISEGTFSEKIK